MSVQGISPWEDQVLAQRTHVKVAGAMAPHLVSSQRVLAVTRGGSVFSRQPWEVSTGTRFKDLLLWAHDGPSLLLWVRLRSALTCQPTLSSSLWGEPRTYLAHLLCWDTSDWLLFTGCDRMGEPPGWPHLSLLQAIHSVPLPS